MYEMAFLLPDCCDFLCNSSANENDCDVVADFFDVGVAIGGAGGVANSILILSSNEDSAALLS